MRPCGPVPVRRAGSTFWSAAILRARGEMRRRSSVAGLGEAGPSFSEVTVGRRGSATPATGAATGAGVEIATGAGAGLAASLELGPPVFGAGAAGASTVSPGLPTAQRAAPMAIWEPAGAKILRSVPSKNDSSSIVALSVSTSARMSPDFTASPSFRSHLTSVPTVMVSLSLGMSMIWAMGGGK